MFTIFSATNSNDLKKLLFEEIKAQIDSEKQLVLVVPAQASLSMEKEAFKVLGKDGFMSLRILRGQKFQEEILSSTRKPGKVVINTIGRSMLLSKIAKEKAPEFESFKSVAKDPEFLDLAGDYIVQLKQNTVDREKLEEISKNSKGLLKGKLHDMDLLYTNYEKAMEGKFQDTEDLVLFTANMAKDADIVKNSLIYYYGFYSFTNREILLFKELEKASKGLSIALLLGEEFAVTKDTKRKLILSFPNTKVIENTNKQESINAEEIKLVCCANPYSQALSIAADIKKHVREDGLSYSDIAVLTGNSPSMLENLKRVFSRLEVPYFADEKKSILHSNAIESLVAALDAIESFGSNEIIRFAKANCFGFEESDIESFQNYVKLYHIKANSFEKPFKYGKEHYGEDFEKLELIRLENYRLLSKFKTDIDQKQSVREKAESLYYFIKDELKLDEMLQNLSKEQEEKGFLDSSEESLQIWDSLVLLLDQMVELLGDEIIETQEFSSMLKAALLDIKVGVLPQAEGKVILGNISRSQIDDIKALYIAGFNDDIIPSKNDALGILTEKELAYIKSKGIILSKDSDNLVAEEIFSIFKSISSAKDYLYLSYCKADAGGEELKISPVLSKIKKEYALSEVKDILNAGDETAFLEGRELASLRISEKLRGAISGENLPDIWKKTYNQYLEDDTLKSALRYTNKRGKLDDKLTQKLFASGDEFKVSPSRMDKFASCPFKHYISYGLYPKEEKEFGMNAAEIGTVHHEVLLKLCEKLSAPAKEKKLAITDPSSLWMTVSNEALKKMTEEIIDSMTDSSLDGVMSSSKENEYKSKRLRASCTKFAVHMVEQVRHSVIDEMFFESDFGKTKAFPAIRISTPNGIVNVEGRIDRIDLTKKESGNFVKVIDYKSGNIKFKKDLIEQGLSLQLMIYLESASSAFDNSDEGGIYYFHIKDVTGTARLEEFDKEDLSEEVLEKIEKEYRLDGMDVDKEFKEEFLSTLTNLCNSLASGEISPNPKKVKSYYNSCEYCPYSAICQKDIY